MPAYFRAASSLPEQVLLLGDPGRVGLGLDQRGEHALALGGCCAQLAQPGGLGRPGCCLEVDRDQSASGIGDDLSNDRVRLGLDSHIGDGDATQVEL